MIYKLTYLIAGDTELQEVLAHNEIALAAALLEMERDVGMLCHNISIERCEYPDDYQGTQDIDNLQHIRHCANVLEDQMRKEFNLPKRKK